MAFSRVGDVRVEAVEGGIWDSASISVTLVRVCQTKPIQISKSGSASVSEKFGGPLRLIKCLFLRVPLFRRPYLAATAITRSPYSGPARKLVFAFDVGTTHSGVCYASLDPGIIPETKPVTT